MSDDRLSARPPASAAFKRWPCKKRPRWAVFGRWAGPRGGGVRERCFALTSPKHDAVGPLFTPFPPRPARVHTPS